MAQTDIQINFSPKVNYNIKKVEVRSSKRLVVKSDYLGVSKVTDFDFSNLTQEAGTFSAPNGYDDICYSVTVLPDNKCSFRLAGFDNSDRPSIQKSYTSFPAYPFLDDAETETEETITETPDWLPDALTISELSSKLKSRVAGSANTFDVAHIGEVSKNTDAYKNVIAFFESWLGAAWKEVEDFENEESTALTETQLRALVTECEQQVLLGTKWWYYAASVTEIRQLWKAKFAAYELWTTAEDGNPDTNWRSDQGVSAYTASDWDKIINTHYPKAQAFSVGVEL